MVVHGPMEYILTGGGIIDRYFADILRLFKDNNFEEIHVRKSTRLLFINDILEKGSGEVHYNLIVSA